MRALRASRWLFAAAIVVALGNLVGTAVGTLPQWEIGVPAVFTVAALLVALGGAWSQRRRS